MNLACSEQRHIQKHKQAGFTLIEVMMALMVFAVVSIGISRVTSQGAQNALYLQEKTLATWVAQNRLVELRLSNELRERTFTSTVEMAGREWHVEAKVESLPPSTLVESLFEGTVSVAPIDDKESFITSLTEIFVRKR